MCFNVITLTWLDSITVLYYIQIFFSYENSHFLMRSSHMYLRTCIFFCLKKNEITLQFCSKLTTVVAMHAAGQQMYFQSGTVGILVMNYTQLVNDQTSQLGSVDDSVTANEIVRLCRVVVCGFCSSILCGKVDFQGLTFMNLTTCHDMNFSLNYW